MLDIHFYNSGYLNHERDEEKYNYSYAINTADYPTPHSHIDYWEFCIITEGAFKNHIIGKGEEIYDSGTLSFMTTSDKHYFTKISPTLKYINIPIRESKLRQLLEIISPALEEKLIKGKRSFKVSDGLIFEIENLVNRCNMLGAAEDDKKEGLLCSAVLLILQELNVIHLNVTDNMPLFIKKLTAVIESADSVRLKVSDLEGKMNYSSAQLNRLFNEHTGMPPGEYLMRHKFRYAMNMLLNTDIPIREISMEIGYSNLSHFFGNFKKMYGITPGECRRNGKAVEYY